MTTQEQHEGVEAQLRELEAELRKTVKARDSVQGTAKYLANKAIEIEEKIAVLARAERNLRRAS